MRRLLSSCVIGLSLAADPIADRITSLPGWADPFPSARYSGFLSGSAPNRRISYFFVTSESAAPENDPVVLWLNGGYATHPARALSGAHKQAP